MASGQNAIAVLVVADVRLYREGLSTSLGAQPGLVVIGHARNAGGAVDLVMSSRPDVVILDMATRDSLHVARAIVNASPSTHVVAFAIEEVDRDILVCTQAGITAWVPCEASLDDLVRTIASVVHGELACSPRLTALIVRQLASVARAVKPGASHSALTSRQREIVALIDRGLSNKEIAQRLHLEVATVKNHVHNILHRLQVTRRSDAAAYVGGSILARVPRSTLTSS